MSTITTESGTDRRTSSAGGDEPVNEPQAFESPEGLRALIVRLHEAGHGAWRSDPDAAALMAFCSRRFGRMARKHGCDPWVAAAAAFDAMRHPSMRTADDPWAMVTRAVKVTLIAEERANGLLCSVDQARRPQNSVFHDAERFSAASIPSLTGTSRCGSTRPTAMTLRPLRQSTG
ncbi:hypothetical protein [Miniimonas arenae]|uniref:hypothetical protein n=1 Tax=Miniimonas arenae TaxID=676201 RepID=UPI00319DEAA8